MFERDDRIYYGKRAAQATELGERATNPKIAALHYEMAHRYAILSVQGSQAKPQLVACSSAQGVMLDAPRSSVGYLEFDLKQARRRQRPPDTALPLIV